MIDSTGDRPGRLELLGAIRFADLDPGDLYSGMSRAFVNEDAGAGDAAPRFPLPSREDPSFDGAAARALLRGADLGDTATAEAATGTSVAPF